LLNPLEKKKEWGTQIATTFRKCEEKAMPLTNKIE
jgi:hypothetical protein